MKISLNWLKDYIDLSGIAVDDIVEKITYAGLEVEEVIDQAKQLDNFVVGYLIEAKKHPNADKLSLCRVSDGSGEYNVVCGAPNVATGQKIAFAKVGAIVPNGGFKIEKAKIRGEVSFGMICSEKELGLSDNHDGIMVLDSELNEGTPLSDALGINDVLIDAAVTPNRSDALSHIGIARDLAALFGRKLYYPEIKINESQKKSSECASVEIIDKDKCPRYVGKVVLNVEIKESPEWIKKRLKNIGLRPINNIVDATNYVLHEVGQPLHAFDLDNLADKKIIVRCAGTGEKFVTLDSKERKMKSSDLMICDGKKAVAVAGVMGGENSEVTSSTKNILIESAYFNPSSVRKTAKHLSLSTDASYRFERGTDYDITVWAAKRCAQLIFDSCGGEVLSGEIDAYPEILTKRNTELRYARVKKILGYDIPAEKVDEILESLGFEITGKDQEKISVIIPSFRNDVEREIDLIEEIARIYGYKNIPEIEKIPITLEEKVDQSAFLDKMRSIINSFGFYEILTNSLLEESISNKFAKAIPMMNPQSSEMSHLRTSLIPGMLRTISNNLKVNEKDLRLFETGKVFRKLNDSAILSFNDFEEKEQLLIAVTGNAIRTEWFDKDRLYDIYDLKGYVESICEKLLPGIKLTFLLKERVEGLRSTFSLQYESVEVGNGGLITNDILKIYDVAQTVYVFQFDLTEIKKIELPKRRFSDLLKFPKVYRDFAFVVDTSVDAGSVEEIIWKASSNLLHNIKLFDIFQSESLGTGKKSMAFQLEYFDKSRTLTEEEIEKDFRSAIKAIETELKAQLRGI